MCVFIFERDLRGWLVPFGKLFRSDHNYQVYRYFLRQKYFVFVYISFQFTEV